MDEHCRAFWELSAEELDRMQLAGELAGTGFREMRRPQHEVFQELVRARIFDTAYGNAHLN